MISTASPIGVFGDWHGHLGWAIASIEAAADAGVRTMLHVGDFGLDFPGRARGRFEKRLNGCLVERDLMLIVSPGNHDNHDTIATLPVGTDGLAAWRSNIRVLPRGGRTIVEGLVVGGLGGAYSVDQHRRTEGKDWWANEEPTHAEAARLIADGPVDILITHDVPASVPLASQLALPPKVVARAEMTRKLLDDVVRLLRPPQVFAGHWHQRVIHELPGDGGGATRVDVLANELQNLGNGVLIWPNHELPMKVTPLRINTR
ncbi:metallophosphoesterase [Arthrobacter zhaoguopingii]|uniref:metallophosphoesterase n=1 Tax=Arthrobacter zhaoguopingii TaxID=2681491 RepID=UPI00135C838A|nr:metallophosphoesterase [Arthrobacter zhaoguopingii]